MKRGREQLLTWLVALTVLLGPVAAPAAEKGAESPDGKRLLPSAETRRPQEPMPSVPWTRMAAGGVFVGAVGLVALYLWKRRRHAPGSCLAEVLESRSLSGEVSIHLVGVGERVFVIAASGETVQKIAEVQRDVLPETEEPQSSTGMAHFRAVLHSAMGETGT